METMLADGVYGLCFKVRPTEETGDRSEGIAVLRAGRILGSDPHGGVFTGHYLEDGTGGDTLVMVQVAVPPHGVLLTGFEAGPDGALVEVEGRFPWPNPVSSAVVEVAGAPVAVELRYVGALTD